MLFFIGFQERAATKAAQNAETAVRKGDIAGIGTR